MASKKFTYVLTETAETDLDEIFEYIAVDLVNPDAASAFADELEEKLDEVCKAPKSGRLVDNEFLKRDDIRRTRVGNFIAYYVIDDAEKHIVVLRVVYSKRDQDRVLKEI